MKMEYACEADNEAVNNSQPAIQKVKLMPEVMGLLNRQNIQHAVLDPETNFLQSVKYFLEPLQSDGSLPAYNIQRDIFAALTRMPIEKEALLSSGIGKVVLFYTKTKRAQPDIKRMAERLMGEWSRPILKRTDDYKKRMIDTRFVDTKYVLNTGVLPPFPLLLPRSNDALTFLVPQHPQSPRPALLPAPVVAVLHARPPPLGRQAVVRLGQARRAARQGPGARAHEFEPGAARVRPGLVHRRAREYHGLGRRGSRPPARGFGWRGGV